MSFSFKLWAYRLLVYIMLTMHYLIFLLLISLAPINSMLLFPLHFLSLFIYLLHAYAFLNCVDVLIREFLFCWLSSLSSDSVKSSSDIFLQRVLSCYVVMLTVCCHVQPLLAAVVFLLLFYLQLVCICSRLMQFIYCCFPSLSICLS